MTWSKEFVELDKKLHDRPSFSCGKKELDEFLDKRASQNMQAGVSRTFVLPEEELQENDLHKICAFYTIAPSSIERASLPENIAKRLPLYPVPVFVIGQLAVNEEYMGQGLGKITLVAALRKLNEVNQVMPAFAVIVDCLDEDAHRFYLKYGFMDLEIVNGRQRMFLSMKTVDQLFKR